MKLQTKDENDNNEDETTNGKTNKQIIRNVNEIEIIIKNNKIMGYGGAYKMYIFIMRLNRKNQ